MHVSISGGIAVGKTTLAGELSAIMPECQCFIEYPERSGYLSEFYEGMKKWAFHSRIGMLALFLGRYERLDAAKGVVLMDRCVHELITFARLQYDAGNFSERDFHIYKSIYDAIVALVPPLDIVIYLQCSASIALARIKTRQRPFEANVTDAYLSRICEYYDPWLCALPASTQVLRYITDDGLDVRKVRDDVRRAHSLVTSQRNN
jgi:deoxyadenosine/deoxycytidine kinase